MRHDLLALVGVEEHAEPVLLLQQVVRNLHLRATLLQPVLLDGLLDFLPAVSGSQCQRSFLLPVRRHRQAVRIHDQILAVVDHHLLVQFGHELPHLCLVLLGVPAHDGRALAFHRPCQVVDIDLGGIAQELLLARPVPLPAPRNQASEEKLPRLERIPLHVDPDLIRLVVDDVHRLQRLVVDRQYLVESGVPLVPAPQVPAVVIGNVEDSRQDVDGPQPRPSRTLLANEVVGVRDVRPAALLLFHVAGEQRPEHEGMGAQPDQFPLHVPAMFVGAAEKRLHAGILGNGGEGVGQEIAAGIGDTKEILMRRREGLARQMNTGYKTQRKWRKRSGWKPSRSPPFSAEVKGRAVPKNSAL